ncbi:hypothetical protein SDC9_50275 [bioreactor metagenome]|uniref:Uncharacterized protein n=1 Tax=bioreactor metagenome TaxID=1076179 RepID=A0A644WKJ5_9ZZZZ
MPVFVGDLFREAVHGLDFSAVQGITQLAAVGAQAAPQIPLFSGEVGEGRRFADTELLQGGPGRVLRYFAGLPDGFFKSVSQRFVQRLHHPAPSLCTVNAQLSLKLH